MIDFKHVSLMDKSKYESYHLDGKERGCEYSFANLNMWGQQNFAEIHGHLVLFTHYGGKCLYPFPLGKGDKKAVLDAIMADAEERGISCCFTGIYEDDKETLEKLYPGKFRFTTDEGTYDYVYDINDLADLGGRKYHSKRNHIHRFSDIHPDYAITPISEDNIHLVKEMIDKWYELRLQVDPDGDYLMEQKAVGIALSRYRELELEGLMLMSGEEVLAVTMGSRMLDDTFDVHFEKALADVQGAYTVINCEFAKYIRDKYPEVKYLDREEDMGIEGLRKAKLSYKPHHMIKKYWAHPIEGNETVDEPADDQIPMLRELWTEAFGDGDEFLDMFFLRAFSKERSRCITSNGEVAAALYWFDCEHKGEKIAYIYAVATAKKYRGQRLCHVLMEDTHKHLKDLEYAGAVLVPGSKALFDFYSGMGYEICSSVKEFECEASDNHISVREINTEEYAELRRAYLPEGGIIQEKGNLDFLEMQAKFYTGEDFLLAARGEGDKLRGIELLGNAGAASDIVKALGYEQGAFRSVGDDKAFAMYYPLTEDSPLPPAYFGLAFD